MTVFSCQFWTPSDHPKLGNCAKGFHHGKPSVAYCMRCSFAKPTDDNGSHDGLPRGGLMGGCGKIAAGAIGLAKAAAGIGRADVDTVERRRALCQACPEAVPCVGNIGKRWVCQQCGCLIRAKTALASETCPLGKW